MLVVCFITRSYHFVAAGMESKKRQSRLVSLFRHANVTIRNLTPAAPRIIGMFNYERHYSEKGNQMGTEANVENTPAVRRIGASICA